MASRRNNNGNKTPRSELLQPLPAEGGSATIGPDEVRELITSTVRQPATSGWPQECPRIPRRG